MKKYLVILLAVLFMVPVTNFAQATMTDISSSGEALKIGENDGAFYDFDLTHDVDRISAFTVVAQTTEIQEIGSTVVAQFTVQNNTRDGYKVELQSENGFLKTNDQLDGEDDIPYTARVKNKVGQLGIGMNLQDQGSYASGTIKDSPGTVIKLTSAKQTTATNVAFDLHVDIGSDMIDEMTMAGNFKDTLTLTYTDL